MVYTYWSLLSYEKAVNFKVTEGVESAADTANQESQGASNKSTVSSSMYSLPDGREVFIDETMIQKCRDLYFLQKISPLKNKSSLAFKASFDTWKQVCKSLMWMLAMWEKTASLLEVSQDVRDSTNNL